MSSHGEEEEEEEEELTNEMFYDNTVVMLKEILPDDLQDFLKGSQLSHFTALHLDEVRSSSSFPLLLNYLQNSLDISL